MSNTVKRDRYLQDAQSNSGGYYTRRMHANIPLGNHIVRLSLLVASMFTLINANGQTRVSTYDKPTFELLFGGYTVYELNCDCTLFSKIRNEPISLRNNTDSSIIKIDSFVANVFIPRGPVNRYEVKGEIFPSEVQDYLKRYDTGVMIAIPEIYYYREDKYLFHFNSGRMLWICKPQIERIIREGEYLPGYNED